MKTPTLKEFMTALKARIDQYTHEELKDIILAQGMALAPRERALFLEGFALPEKKRGKKRKQEKDGDDREDFLLKEIASFGRRVEKYEFTNGWGWDDRYGDERAWGDDSWAIEIDDLFSRILDIYAEGNYPLARRAFESLLAVYEEGLEEGKFSGYDHDEMIETDMDEAKLKYFRCVYLTETPAERPQAVWNAISRYSSDARDLNIHGLINVDMEELPQLEDFGQRWLELLRKQTVSLLSVGLLKEAVSLFQGVAGLERLATEDGLKYPSAFIAWLEALKKERKYKDMIRAASLGLERLPAHLQIRAKIADFLREAAVRLKKEDLIDRSLMEALRADPCLERLLDALDNSRNREKRKAVLDETLALVEILRKKEGGSRTWEIDRLPDFWESDVRGNLGLYCHLLKGDYENAAALLEKSKPLGWSSGEDPGGLGVPFFLLAEWNQGKKLTANLSALWNGATDPGPTFSFGNFVDDEWNGDEDRPGDRRPAKPSSRFRKYLEAVLKEMPPQAAAKEKYFSLAEKTALKRIDAIVGNKRRKSYWKAAELLLAVAEVYWSNDRPDEGRALIARINDKYKRHSAFRGELRNMAKKSGIFAIH